MSELWGSPLIIVPFSCFLLLGNNLHFSSSERFSVRFLLGGEWNVSQWQHWGPDSCWQTDPSEQRPSISTAENIELLLETATSHLYGNRIAILLPVWYQTWQRRGARFKKWMKRNSQKAPFLCCWVFFLFLGCQQRAVGVIRRTQDRTLTSLVASCFLSKDGCRGSGRAAEGG